MRVIVKNNFYEFQNNRTDDIFEEQKLYLSKIIEKYEAEGDYEKLLTVFFSLYNLSEGLIDEFVQEKGLNETLNILKAKSVK